MVQIRKILMFIGVGVSLTACATSSSLPLEGGTSTSAVGSEVSIDRMLRLANASLAGGDVDSGIKLLRQVVAKYPESIEAHEILAQTYFTVGALPEASVAFDQLRMLEGGKAIGLLGLGRVALANGDAVPAIEYFAEALREKPDDRTASNGTAVAYDYLGEHAKAQEIYTKILQKDPADHAVTNNMALSQALSGAVGPSIASLSSLVNGPARLPEARFNLALAYGLSGDMTAAREILENDLNSQAIDGNLSFYRQISSR